MQTTFSLLRGLRRYGSAPSLYGMIAVAFLSFMASDAAAQTVKSRLSPRGKARVQADGCRLRVVSPADSTARLRVRCEGTGNRFRNRRTPGIILLRKGQQAAITTRECSLVRTRTNLKRVDVTCVVTPPTTPTATPTATLTPTITPTPTRTPTPNANLLLSSSQIAGFNTSHPTGVETPRALTGVVAGESIVTIDRRPQNGLLYGLGYNPVAQTLQLYAINSDTAVATAIGATGSFVDIDGVTTIPVGNGSSTRFGMDFNPTVDRIRVVTNEGPGGTAGQNFRINPNTGAFVDGNLGGAEGSVSGTNMDGALNGVSTTVQETAYTNNAANQTTTTEYTLDSVGDRLCIQVPPNAGTQASCQSLSSGIDGAFGFDIAPGINGSVANAPITSGNGVAIVTFGGQTNQSLANIDLTNGAILSSATLGAGITNVLGFSIQEPAGISMVALNGSGTSLLRFNSAQPGTVTTIAITGVVAGEALVGIDYRPATGQLFALGVDDALNIGTLYRVDPQTGAASIVGSSGGISLVDALGLTIDLPAATAGYGFAFNPTVDRIRVVTGTGLNFRVNPNTGTAVDGDANAALTQPDSVLNGATTSADGVAYTNATGGQSVTTLYAFDAASDAFYIQNPPNAGQQTNQKVVTLSGSTLDFTAVNGFAIRHDVRVTESNAGVISGNAFAVLTVGGVSSLYSIDLVSGAASNLGTVGDGTGGVNGLALGVTRVN